MQLSKNNLWNIGLFLIFFMLSMTGLSSYKQLTSFYYQYNLLNVNLVLEFLFVILVVKSIRAFCVNRIDVLLGSLVFIYLLYSAMNSLFFQQDKLSDFLIIYKVFFYSLIFLSIRMESFIRIEWLISFFMVILFSILVKYMIGVIYFSIERPGLLYENNFELLFVNIIFYFLYGKSVLVKKYAVFFLIIIAISTMISGSRSAALCFMITLLFIYKGGVRKILIVFPILIFLLFYQIYTRGFYFEEIDRFRFFIQFISLYKDFSLAEYIFGVEPITPLPIQVCDKFKFYAALISDIDSLKCYSVVFHSFILRALFDHGLVGFFIMMFIYYRIISRNIGSNFSHYALLLAVANGLSVSSLNSIYFNLPLLLSFLMVRENEIK